MANLNNAFFSCSPCREKRTFQLFIQNGCNLFFGKAAVGIQVRELTRTIDRHKRRHRTDTHSIQDVKNSRKPMAVWTASTKNMVSKTTKNKHNLREGFPGFGRALFLFAFYFGFPLVVASSGESPLPGGRR